MIGNILKVDEFLINFMVLLIIQIRFKKCFYYFIKKKKLKESYVHMQINLIINLASKEQFHYLFCYNI